MSWQETGIQSNKFWKIKSYTPERKSNNIIQEIKGKKKDTQLLYFVNRMSETENVNERDQKKKKKEMTKKGRK